MKDTEFHKSKALEVAKISGEICARAYNEPMKGEENSSDAEAGRQLAFEKLKAIADELCLLGAKK